MTGAKSQAAFAEAKRWMPGGVNSPVRAFAAVGGEPFFADHGEGPYLYDIDGNRYVDYILSWGPLILGHAHPEVIRAIMDTAQKGTSFGVPTELETEMARMVHHLVPAIEVVRMVNSGTEATMSALRLARAYTGRSCIVKFEGCYHGHADSLLVKAGSGVATLGLPDSPGVPQATARATLTLPYNDLDAARELFAREGEKIAAVIVEGVAGNMGGVPPKPGYLKGLEELVHSHGALFILDEVMTGFRVALGGAVARFGLHPDLITLGKVIGGGMPVGAYGGKREIMEQVAPSGPVYQAGTLSGNPLAMVAGLTTLRWLKQAEEDGLYARMEEYGQRIVDVFVETGKARGIPVWGQAIGGMFGLFFHEGPVTDFRAAKASDDRLYARFFHALLDHGVLLPPSQLESGFLSAVHTHEQLEMTEDAIRKALQSL
ncbi:glutamate-1-semialdehyde 2,1-aminomutase [Alicyclobacillus herbarius]|uniref:glutamate-1-semialdehyde 2,1-aminomutase n=1 Tax=Alicyclobacillus herbarius TaxID=122960 RepID=UPI0023545149|nr:glutamate-1-semialdehyde 2,1-aminomutase [Alicyclobacillus herbarius]